MVGSEDETKLFDVDSKTETEPMTGVPKLPIFQSNKTLSYRAKVPEPNFNGKTLSCEVEQDGFEKKSVTANLVVKCKLCS